MDDPIAKLAINRLTIIPFTSHFVLQMQAGTALSSTRSIDFSLSYSDIVNYNTMSRASSF